ncbi:MAG: hypothetical protein JHC87_09370 [Thermoleophilaceae bacterium]|nr:hypothetical protein [Thermoleophilaceae bacterium]
MTEPSPERPRRVSPRRPTRIGGWPLKVATALAIFFCLFAALTWRARAGLDPVLGRTSNTQAVVPQKVIKRIVVVRKVVITRLPAKVAAASSGSSSGGGGSYTAPASTYSAPVQHYTPPVYTPPPAPVTRAS